MDIKSLSGIIQQSASDGKMSKDELKQLKTALIQSNLPDNEKSAIIRLAEKITEFSKGGLFKKGNINPDEMAQLKAMEPDLQDSNFAREMLNLFEEHVQPEHEFSIFTLISNFFSNLFGRHSDTSSDDSQAIPDTQSRNNTKSYHKTPINPTEINFNVRKPSNSEYPTEPEQDPIASIPDYEPKYFSASPVSDAEKMYERHEMIAKFLMTLGVDMETAYKDSCKIEHDLSDISFECMKKHYLQVCSNTNA